MVAPDLLTRPEVERRTRSVSWAWGVVPLAVAYTIFFLVPELMLLRNAFYEGTAGQPLTGPTTETLKNTLGSEFTIQSLLLTLKLCLITSIGAVVLGFPLAWASVRLRHGGALVFTIVVGSLLSGSVPRALGWQVALAPNGPISDVLMDLHLTSGPVHINDGFLAVCIGTIHATLPLAAIGLMPACDAIQRSVLDASYGLGASRLRTFATIILPQVRTAVLAMAIIVFADTSGAFTIPSMLGGGRVRVLSFVIFQQMTQVLDYPTAAALGVLLLAIVAFVALCLGLIGRERTGKAKGQKT